MTDCLYRPKVFLVSAFEPTIFDGLRPMRFMGITKAAIKKGFDVEVFTSTFRHGIKKSRFTNDYTLHLDSDNTKIHFHYAIPYTNNVGFLRFFSHTIWGISVFAGLIKRDKPELIISALPTLTVNFFLSIYSRIYGVKLNIDIIDPWPDCFVTWTNNRRLKFLIWVITRPMWIISNIALKTANSHTAISSEYIEWASKNKIDSKGRVFYPAIDLALVEKYRNKNTDNNKLKLVYAGSYSDTYDISCIIESATQLKDYKNIEFHFAGKGKNEVLIQQARELGMNIIIHGVLNARDLIKLLTNSDIGLIQHKQGASQTVTYKFFDYLSAGCVLINSLQSEMKTLIMEYELGVSHEPSDSIALTNHILYFYKNRSELENLKINAVKFTQEKGDLEKVYSGLLDFACSEP